MPLASRGILSYGYAVRQMVAHELEFERVRRTEKARAERERELAELDKKGSAKAAAEAMFGDARQAEAQTAAERALADEKAAAEAAEVEEKRKQEEARKRKQELKDRVLEKITARKPDAVVQAKVRGTISLQWPPPSLIPCSIGCNRLFWSSAGEKGERFRRRRRDGRKRRSQSTIQTPKESQGNGRCQGRIPGCLQIQRRV